MPSCHQPITWQQRRAFRHVDVVRMTRWGLEWASEVERKRGFKWIWRCFLLLDEASGLSVSQTAAHLLGFSLPVISRLYREQFQKEKLSSDGLHTHFSTTSQMGSIGFRSWSYSRISLQDALGISTTEECFQHLLGSMSPRIREVWKKKQTTWIGRWC